MTNEKLNSLLQTDFTEKKYEFSDELLEKTADFVKMAHSGVYDKMGMPYYTHPYRVCKLLKERFGNSSSHTPGQINYACILALLHDVCEDTNRLNRYLISIRILRKRLENQGATFKCDCAEVNMINNFRTPTERKRIENKK